MISVLILTYDEQENIEACIASLPWRSNVWVLDSGSTDRTVEIAERMNAKVEVRAFVDYADQRNFGLNLRGHSDWIVMVDADERMTPELATEIERAVLKADEKTAMFRVRRQDIFMGEWIRRSSGYPTWFPRVFRRGRVRVERSVNEEYRPMGDAHQLSGHLLHYPFEKGLHWWFNKHNIYSTMEARQISSEWQSRRIETQDVLSPDPAKRRAVLKQILYRLPFRPFVVFLYLFICRGGLLDGKRGYYFAMMRMAYEVMIDVKMSFFENSLSQSRDGVSTQEKPKA